ncbi:dTDP-glucose 4,6-dehydratase [Botrimarina hoheduenensis]|uniref:dTDP-glucose 4,6-dehydratase n=1 Tax=Botrimarina hoheduenensis TaxID=2528000 RepID=A0A5C5WDC2_9BACT|nr:dTDP-glucose 4,6-dehydratase [Botrimarina hoheduenensis]TWT48497.1 dTDP-glucose 4,6-dehydratase [Botrimarina hoheduenensis]
MTALCRRQSERILVTGGCGFIGSALIRRLLRPGEGAARQVLNLDLLTYAGLIESVTPIDGQERYQFLRADVADLVAVSNAIARFRPDTLLHLAAESHVDRSIMAPQAFVHTNVLGTAAVLAAWRDYRDRLAADESDRLLMVHVSTDEVYGPIAAPKESHEGDPYAPSSPYSATKAAADHLVRAYQTTYGLQAIVTHATNNYGPRQCPEKLIPLAIERALARQPIPLYGDGQQVRDWLHVDDHCEALLAVTERGVAGETYHIGAADRHTNAETIELLCEQIDAALAANGAEAISTRQLVTRVADRPGHDRRYALNTDKICRELNWSPRIGFEQGLASVVRWRLENPAWIAAALERLARYR